LRNLPRNGHHQANLPGSKWPDWGRSFFRFTPIIIAVCVCLAPSLAQAQNGSTKAESSSASSLSSASSPQAGSPAQNSATRQPKNRHQQIETSKGASKNSASSDSKVANANSPFGAFASGNRGPISIQSDSLALDYKQNGVLFRGHVHATQADGALTSDLLNVKYGKDFHQVENMAADGNVHISQGLRWCTSDHAVLDQDKHTVILTGSPICHDAQDQIAGTRITVHLDTGKSDVEAAKAVIFPQQSKTRDNEPLADDVK
jgi:lipopolysaccharide transport protein LptA